MKVFSCLIVTLLSLALMGQTHRHSFAEPLLEIKTAKFQKRVQLPLHINNTYHKINLSTYLSQNMTFSSLQYANHKDSAYIILASQTSPHSKHLCTQEDKALFEKLSLASTNKKLPSASLSHLSACSEEALYLCKPTSKHRLFNTPLCNGEAILLGYKKSFIILGASSLKDKPNYEVLNYYDFKTPYFTTKEVLNYVFKTQESSEIELYTHYIAKKPPQYSILPASKTDYAIYKSALPQRTFEDRWSFQSLENSTKNHFFYLLSLYDGTFLQSLNRIKRPSMAEMFLAAINTSANFLFFLMLVTAKLIIIAADLSTHGDSPRRTPPPIVTHHTSPQRNTAHVGSDPRPTPYHHHVFQENTIPIATPSLDGLSGKPYENRTNNSGLLGYPPPVDPPNCSVNTAIETAFGFPVDNNNKAVVTGFPIAGTDPTNMRSSSASNRNKILGLITEAAKDQTQDFEYGNTTSEQENLEFWTVFVALDQIYNKQITLPSPSTLPLNMLNLTVEDVDFFIMPFLMLEKYSTTSTSALPYKEVFKKLKTVYDTDASRAANRIPRFDKTFQETLQKLRDPYLNPLNRRFFKNVTKLKELDEYHILHIEVIKRSWVFLWHAIHDTRYFTEKDAINILDKTVNYYGTNDLKDKLLYIFEGLKKSNHPVAKSFFTR